MAVKSVRGRFTSHAAQALDCCRAVSARAAYTGRSLMILRVDTTVLFGRSLGLAAAEVSHSFPRRAGDLACFFRAPVSARFYDSGPPVPRWKSCSATWLRCRGRYLRVTLGPLVRRAGVSADSCSRFHPLAGERAWNFFYPPWIRLLICRRRLHLAARILSTLAAASFLRMRFSVNRLGLDHLHSA